jgi:hypothetical protein
LTTCFKSFPPPSNICALSRRSKPERWAERVPECSVPILSPRFRLRAGPYKSQRRAAIGLRSRARAQKRKSTAPTADRKRLNAASGREGNDYGNQNATRGATRKNIACGATFGVAVGASLGLAPESAAIRLRLPWSNSRQVEPTDRNFYLSEQDRTQTNSPQGQ